MFGMKIKFFNLWSILQYKIKRNNLKKVKIIENRDIPTPSTIQQINNWNFYNLDKDFSTFFESNKSFQTLIDKLSLDEENWFYDEIKPYTPKITKSENNFLTKIKNLKNEKELKKYFIQTFIITVFIGVISYILLHLYFCEPVCY